MFLHARLCEHAHMEARGQGSMSSLNHSSPYHWRQAALRVWMASNRSELRTRYGPPCLDFPMAVRAPSSDLYTCLASPLPTKPFPQPPSALFIGSEHTDSLLPSGYSAWSEMPNLERLPTVVSHAIKPFWQQSHEVGILPALLRCISETGRVWPLVTPLIRQGGAQTQAASKVHPPST